MALTERSRSAIYLGLTNVIDDDQAVEEMLSYFPARDVEEPVTKEYFRAEMASMELRIIDRMDDRFDASERKVDGKIDALDRKLDTKIDALEKKLDTKIDALDKKFDEKLTSQIGALDTKIDALDKKFEARFDRMSAYVMGGNVVMLATLAGVIFMALRF